MDIFENVNTVLESSIRKLNADYTAGLFSVMKEQLSNISAMYQSSMEEQERLKATIVDLEEQNRSFMNVSLIIATKNENIRLQNEIQLLTKRLKYYENTRPHMNRQTTVEATSDIEKKVQSASNEATFIPKQTVQHVVSNESIEETTDCDDSKQKEIGDTKEIDHATPIETCEQDVEDIDEEEEEKDEEEEEEEKDEEEEEVSVVEKIINGETYFVSDDEHMIVYERVYEEDDWEIGDEIGFAYHDESNVLQFTRTG